MTLSRPALVVNALVGAFVVLFWGLDVTDHFRARFAEVSALTELPRLWFALPVTLLGLAGLGVLAWGTVKKKDASFKGFRVLPILLVVAGFVNVFVLSGEGISLGSVNVASATLYNFAAELQARSDAAGVVDDERAIQQVVAGLGRPPYLVKGAPLERFGVQVRKGCDGPISGAPGAAPGTFLYCVSKDRKVGWITLWSLPAEIRFGPPGMFTVGGDIQLLQVRAEAPQAEQPLPSDRLSAPAP